MSLSPLRARVLIAGALSLVLARFATSEPKAADIAKRLDPPPAELMSTTDAEQVGVDACKGCHGTKDPATGQYAKSLDLILTDEVLKYQNNDPHSQAFSVLKSELGTRMGAKLNYDKDPAKWTLCLTCHAVDQTLKEPPGKKVFYTNDGVSCETCHGNAQKWGLPHTVAARWRPKLAKEKSDQGLYDMRDPRLRAERCAACHIGNEQESKVVTHEMYAVGHPPLPGLETVTFSLLQPKHFIPARDVKYFGTPEGKDKSWERYHVREGELHQTRQVAYSAVVGFRESMRLLAEEADKAHKGEMPLDFNQMDCYACHHDLGPQKWRQEPLANSVPGRPGMRPWATALMEVVVEHANKDATTAFKKQFDELGKAYSVQPYGKAGLIADHAANLTSWSNEQYAALGKTMYDLKSSKALLKAIAEKVKQPIPAGTREPFDYDGARQMAWAFKVIYDDVCAAEPGSKSPAIDAALAALEKDLKLSLRDFAPDGKVQPIAKSLNARMEVLYKYDPVKFRETFAGIAGGLK